MDNIEQLVGEILDPTAPYTPWVLQFSQIMVLHYGSNLSIGVEQYAVHLGPELYRQGEFTTREACAEAIRIASNASEGELRATESSYRQAAASLDKKLGL